MKDFMWLIDLKTTFKEFKYIVRVVPEVGTHEHGESTSDLIDECKLAIIGKNTKQHDIVMKSNEMIMKRIRIIEQSEKSNSHILKLI